MNKILLFVAACGLSVISQAFGQSYTYTVENNKTTITGFSAEPSGAITVPATLGGSPVTEIGRSAFKDRAGITSITFAAPASLTRIGPTAFQGCTGLQTITLPSGISAVAPGVFEGCTSLTSVSFPSGVTTIGDSAFADCRSLINLSLPAALTSLGDSAFSNCRSLASLTIPSGVTSIPGQLFQECRTLSSITLPAGIGTIGYAAFKNCVSLTSFSLPTSVTSVAREAFRGCRALVTFNISAALAFMGDRSFDGCSTLGTFIVDPANAAFSSLNGVLFNKTQTTLLLCPAALAGSYTPPGTVTAFAKAALAHCASLTKVIIPSSVTAINEDALYYTTGLTEITIPESVTSIGPWALAGSSLKGVTIPASVTNVGNDAFHYSRQLTYALFSGNAPSMGTSVFDSAAGGFTIYYYASKTGFSTPTWLGYPASALDVPPAIANWLTSQGFSPGIDILSDPNSDGVNFLLAYALGLNPSLNLADSLPIPVLTNGSSRSLSLTFRGDSEGVTYAAETSGDLQSWTTDGVTLSSPDMNGLRTAAVALDSNDPVQFIRLVIVR